MNERLDITKERLLAKFSPRNEAHKNSIPKSLKKSTFHTFDTLDTLCLYHAKKKERSFPSKYRNSSLQLSLFALLLLSLSKNNPFPLPVLARYPIIDQPRQKDGLSGDRSRSVATSGRKWRSSIIRDNACTERVTASCRPRIGASHRAATMLHSFQPTTFIIPAATP